MAELLSREHYATERIERLHLRVAPVMDQFGDPVGGWTVQFPDGYEVTSDGRLHEAVEYAVDAHLRNLTI